MIHSLHKERTRQCTTPRLTYLRKESSVISDLRRGLQFWNLEATREQLRSYNGNNWRLFPLHASFPLDIKIQEVKTYKKQQGMHVFFSNFQF